MIISIAATTDTRGKVSKKMMVNDVSRAYFYAQSDTPTFVKLCDEDTEPGDEGMCGELRVSMYGTRKAAQNWQNCVNKTLYNMGFSSGASSPCIFWHRERDIVTMVHGDDFVSAGGKEDLKWMSERLTEQFEISTEIIGPEERDKKQLKVLNRFITYTSEGIEYESDPRHAEIIVKELGLEECNPVCTPGMQDEPVRKDDEAALDEIETRRY
eukprot:12430674-Karenia_brevis.AAC.1